MKYEAVRPEEAYKMLNPGPLVLVASKGEVYDLAPIAWNCPVDYEPVTKVLFVSDPAHQTALNIKKTGEFALCVPHASQGDIVERCGSVSGKDTDKYSRFSIPALRGRSADVLIPDGCVGWIECGLVRVIAEGSVELFIGEARSAWVREGAWKNGLLKDSEETRLYRYW